MAIKATEISDNVIHAAHCDYITEKIKEVKTLLKNPELLKNNRKRAEITVLQILNSMNEIQLYLEQFD